MNINLPAAPLKTLELLPGDDLSAISFSRNGEKAGNGEKLGERLRLPLSLLSIVVDELSEQIKIAPFEQEASKELQRLARKLNKMGSDTYIHEACLNDLLPVVRRSTRKPTISTAAPDLICNSMPASRKSWMRTTVTSPSPQSLQKVWSEFQARVSTSESNSQSIETFQPFLNDENFTGTNVWKKALMDVFHQLDADGSGTLSTDELRAALQAVGVPKARTQKILMAADIDGSGEIDFAEWKAALGRNSCAEELKDVSSRLVKLSSMESVYGGNGNRTKTGRKPICMLRPDRPMRLTWDIFLGILCFYVAFILPFTSGFEMWLNDSSLQKISTIELAIDVVFLMDVCLNFRTGIFVADGEVDLKAGNVARAYLSTWFFLDLISSIPFEQATRGYITSVRALKLLKIPKIIRALRVIGPLLMSQSELVAQVDQVFQSPLLRVVCRRSSIMIATATLCHWLACMMAYCSSAWLVKYIASKEQEASIWRAYLVGVYWSMTTMTTVGYGDLTGSTDMERIYSVVAMVIGGAYYGYAVGTMCSIVSNRDLNASAYHNRMDAIYAWLDHHRLPTQLRRRILRYFRGYLTQKAVIGEADVINDLSPTLRGEVGKLVIHEDILNNPLFDNLPLNAVTRLQKIVQKVHVDEGHSVVEKGEAGTAMFIVNQGMVRMERFDRKDMKLPPRVLSAGDSFGEEILVGLEERYAYTVTAVKKHASLYMIEEEHFLQLFEHMPDVKDQVVKNATALYEDANRTMAMTGSLSAATANPKNPMSPAVSYSKSYC